MLTSVATTSAVLQDERPGYCLFRVSVSRVVALSPHFTRVTFSGDDLSFFGTDGLDQRIKIVFPVPEFGLSTFDDLDGATWYEAWRAMPDHLRPPFRTYTIRGVRPAAREIDVDFVNHGDGGPAARWLQAATPGDEVMIIGPDARSLYCSSGFDWKPGAAKEVLLVGDETAAPAICSILETLPAGCRAHAFIEIPDAADALPLSRNAQSITWLPRGERELGAPLQEAVRAWVAGNRAAIDPAILAPQTLDDIDVDVDLLWDAPEAGPGDFYAWLAGEASVIKALRRFLVTETGIDRTRVSFMGYWRLGKAEAQG